jgi:hypothetical protein
MIARLPCGSTSGLRDVASEIDFLIGAKTLFQQSFARSRAKASSRYKKIKQPQKLPSHTIFTSFMMGVKRKGLGEYTYYWRRKYVARGVHGSFASFHGDVADNFVSAMVISSVV